MRCLGLERAQAPARSSPPRRPPRRARVSARIFGVDSPQPRERRSSPRRADRPRAARAPLEPAEDALALATDTCWETMIAASPAKPGSRRRNGGGPPIDDKPRDELRILGPQGFGGLAQTGLVHDRAAPDDRAAGPARLWLDLRARRSCASAFSSCAPDALAPSPVLRFAPSPNGALHLGHAYSALCNERIAAALGGRLLLRIEDLDRTRCKPQFESAILDDLAWLGFRFEAAAAPAKRARRRLRRARSRALERRGLVYPCFCSRGRGRARRRRRAIPTARRSTAEPAGPLPARRGAERLARGDRRALAGSTCAARSTRSRRGSSGANLARGERRSTVLPSRPPGATSCSRPRTSRASYHLAVTVDDALQGMSDVVRGRDLLPATSVHRLLQELLGLPAPRYRHHRLVLDPPGRKLSKSAESPPLGALRRSGVSAARGPRRARLRRRDGGASCRALS